MKEKIKKRLEELEKKRKEKNKSQGEFAEIIGVSRESYNAWLHDRKHPNFKSWFKIKDYLEE